MLKEEFEELIKREVNENQYKNIETAYEALPEYMDKMYLASAISNDIGKAINVLSFLGSHISELMGSIIIERQKVESCAYDLINKSHEEDDLKAREIAVRLIGERETVAYTVKEGLPLWEQDKKFIIELIKEECDNCKKIIDDGGCFIIEVEDGSDQKNPYRTGRYCAIKKEAAKKILGQEHSIVYMEKSAYSQIIPQK